MLLPALALINTTPVTQPGGPGLDCVSELTQDKNNCHQQVCVFSVPGCTAVTPGPTLSTTPAAS